MLSYLFANTHILCTTIYTIQLGDNMEYDFGLLIKQLREQRNWTQKQLAEKTGVSRTSIGNYERNIVEPPKEFIANAAVAFGISTDYLLNIKQRGVLHIGDLPPDVQANLENLVESIRRNQR